MKDIIEEIQKHPLEAFRDFSMNPFSSILTDSDFQQAADKHLSGEYRERKIGPKVMVWILCFSSVLPSLAKSMRVVWNQVFLECGSKESSDDRPSRAALTKARNRFPLSYFWDLFYTLQEIFLNRFDSDSLSYREFLLLIVDGTKMNLPKSDSIRDRFGAPSGRQDQPESQPQALVLSLINALSGFCLDFLTLPYASSEYDQMRQIADRLPDTIRQKHPLLLLDGGFYGYKNIHCLMKNDIQFLMRVPRNIKFQTVMEIGPGDKIVKLHPSQSVLNKYPSLPESFRVRLIRYQIPGFKPRYLITTVCPDQMSGKELAGLYHWRWRIEVFFNEVKHVLELSNLRSKNPDGIRKEIVCQMIFNNLIRYAMTEATEDLHRPVFHFSFEKSCELIICASNKMGLHMFEQDGDNRFSERIMQSIYSRILLLIQTHEVKRDDSIKHHEDAYSEELKDPIDDDLIFIDLDNLDDDDQQLNLPYAQSELA